MAYAIAIRNNPRQVPGAGAPTWARTKDPQIMSLML